MERVLSIFNSKDAFKLFKSLFLLTTIVLTLDKTFQFFSFKLVHLSYDHSRWGLHQITKAFNESPEILIVGNSKVGSINSDFLREAKKSIQVISLPGTDLSFWIKFIKGYLKVHPNKATKIILDVPDYELTKDKYLISRSYNLYLHPVLKKYGISSSVDLNEKSIIEQLSSGHLASYQLRKLFIFSLVGIGKRILGQKMNWEGSGAISICKKGNNCLEPKDIGSTKEINFQLPSENKMVKDLISLATKNRDKINFLFMPYHSSRGYKQNARIQSMMSFRNFLIENKFKVYSYIDSQEYRQKNHLFSDIMHLNKAGGTLFAKDLLQDLNF